MLYVLIVLITVGALLYLDTRARSGKSRQPVTTSVEERKHIPTVPDYKKEVQTVIDHYRKEIETRDMAKGCRNVALCAIGKVEDVTIKLNNKDVKQYRQSMKIRLEAFRAAYQGEPSYKYDCSGSRGVDTADYLVDAILKHLHGRNAQA